MTHPFDEQLRRAFDSLADQLRTTVADHVSNTVEELTSSAVAAQQEAADLAARRAAADAERDATARLEGEFARREALVREQARLQGYEDGLQEARAEALAIQEAHDAVARAAADAAARDAAERAAAERAEAEHALLTAQAAVVAAESHVHTETRGQARDSLERLLRAVRAIDATTSLSQTLDALAAAAQAEAERVAVFLVRGETLRVWSHVGFDTLGGAPADVSLADAGVVADAVRAGGAQRAADEQGRPAFAGTFASGALVAVPLMMNGQVIAVLCGDQTSADDQGEWLAWTFEVLARHAARVLESLTALRMAQIGAPSVAPAVAAVQVHGFEEGTAR